MEINRKAALRLRAQGKTYAAIGEDLGVTQQTANRYVLEALAQLRQEAGEAAQEVRELESMRLDRLLESVWPAAETGDIKAIETVLKLMERRSKLMGLDQPERSMSVTVTSSRAELEEEARRLGLPIASTPLTSPLPGVECRTSPEPLKLPASLPPSPESPASSPTSDTLSSIPHQSPGPSGSLPSPGNGTSLEATLPALMSWPGYDVVGKGQSLSGTHFQEDTTKLAPLEELLISYSDFPENP